MYLDNFLAGAARRALTIGNVGYIASDGLRPEAGLSVVRPSRRASRPFAFASVRRARLRNASSLGPPSHAYTTSLVVREAEEKDVWGWEARNLILLHKYPKHK